MTNRLQCPVDKTGGNLLNRPALAALAAVLTLVMAGALYVGLTNLGEPTRISRSGS